mgnify:CR=1 FL=1
MKHIINKPNLNSNEIYVKKFSDDTSDRKKNTVSYHHMSSGKDKDIDTNSIS